MRRENTAMAWIQSISSFVSGALLANAVPHFVHGISGDRFPTPFSRPAGKGRSSAPVNAAWALFNLAVGYFLFRAGKVSSENENELLPFFFGVCVLSLASSKMFEHKEP